MINESVSKIWSLLGGAANTEKMPLDSHFDQTFNLLSDGYVFISKRCEKLQTDIFKTRVLLSSAICIRGEAAAQFFSGTERFTRKGGTPFNVVKLLQGFGSVNLLSGKGHVNRKALFMSFMNDALIGELSNFFQAAWLERRENIWRHKRKINLFEEMNHVLGRTALRWAGIPYTEDEADLRVAEIKAMVDDAGKLGYKQLRAQLLRERSERWARKVIRDIRGGRLIAPSKHPAHSIAHFADPDTGKRLSVKIAAVELINIVRPIAAVSRFLTFAALALHEHPRMADKLNNPIDMQDFAQEVRRFYPFFPYIGGRAKSDLKFKDYAIPKGSWVLLDVYGTNHDPKIWKNPEIFDPSRFLKTPVTPYNLIAQGTGKHHDDHRCPGEFITLAVLREFIKTWTALAPRIEIPRQDLSIPLNRIPALPGLGLEFSYH